MVQKKIIIYYFSGTGNTARLLHRFCTTLKSEGHDVVTHKMENNPPLVFNNKTTIGLAFPVAVQSTFPLVWDFVNSLPEVNGIEIFMLDSMEAFSGGVVGPMRKILTGKGYNCIAAREFKMSSSLNTSPSKIEKGKIKNLKALELVEQYARDLIANKTKWKRIPLLSEWMRSISRSKKIWAQTSRKLSVTDRCVQCGVCIQKCPVSAISLNERSITIDHTLCNSCMRCASKCRRGAILYGGKPLRFSR